MVFYLESKEFSDHQRDFHSVGVSRVHTASQYVYGHWSPDFGKAVGESGSLCSPSFCVAGWELTSSVWLPVVVLPTERHVVKIGTLLLPKVT